MQNSPDSTNKLDALFGSFLRTVSMGCLVAISILMVINVFLRFFPIFSMSWFDEILEGFFAWMVFIGAAALWRENEHFTVTFLPDWLRGSKTGYLLEVSIHLISLLFLLVFTYYSLNLTIRAGDTTPVLMMPKRLLYVCMPLSGAIMAGYSFRNICASIGRLCKSCRPA
jgi:TRAP-type C4-dicarboxylate transport system permease small subunit